MKSLLLSIFAFVALSTTMSAQFTLGAGADLLLGDVTLFGVQGKAHYVVDEQWAGQGTFTYYLPKNDINYWAIDLDAHYQGFGLGSFEGFSLTPFAGLNFFRASANGFSDGDIGLNIGLNAQLPLENGMDFYLEPKFTISGAEGLHVVGGVYF